MAIVGQQISRAYGFNGYVNVFPTPIVTNRAPVNGQDQAENGQVWIDTAGQDAYTMADSANSFWVNSGGGGALFTNLTVTPGPVTIDSILTTITATANVVDVFKLTTGGAAGAASTFTISNTTGILPTSIAISSTSGGVHLSSGLANADAINLQSTAGGVHLESATQMLIESSQAAATDSVEISATALDGGVTLDAGTSGITETTTGTISLISTKNAAPAILINANGGAAETVVISSTQGTSATSVGMSSTLGGIVLETAAAAKDVVLNAVLGSIEITGREAAPNAIVLEATNAAGGVQIKAGSAGVVIGPDADTAVLSMGNVIPTAARTTTIAGGTLGSAIADTVNIGAGGANFVGSSKIVNIANDTLTLGTQTLNLASGNVVGGTHRIDIGTGTGTKSIQIGNPDGLTLTTIWGKHVTAAGTAAALDAHIGTATLTGLTTAAGATETITITNFYSTITASFIVTANVVGAEDAQMTVQKVRPNAGTMTILVKNNGAAALASDLVIAWMQPFA